MQDVFFQIHSSDVSVQDVFLEMYSSKFILQMYPYKMYFLKCILANSFFLGKMWLLDPLGKIKLRINLNSLEAISVSNGY